MEGAKRVTPTTLFYLEQEPVPLAGIDSHTLYLNIIKAMQTGAL